jgi:hypothetical protein
MSEVGDLIRAALAGEKTVEEVADRLHDLGVRELAIREVMPKGHGRN